MKRLRAAQLALDRGWTESKQWLRSTRWEAPRQVRHVVGGKLVLAANRHGCRRELSPVMTLPADVHEVPERPELPWYGPDPRMVSAADVARQRGWDRTRPWVGSSKWKTARQVRCVRKDRVHMAAMWKGKLHSHRCVAKFPLDVHECEAPSWP